MTCDKCGSEVLETDKYCPKCGNQLIDDDKTSQAIQKIIMDDDVEPLDPSVTKSEITLIHPNDEDPALFDPEALKYDEEETSSNKTDVFGRPIEEKTSSIPTKPSYDSNAKYIYFSKEDDLVIPASYQPLSPLGYLGYGLLFLVPIIGWICSIVFSFNKNNIARKNFARALLIVNIIIILSGGLTYLFNPDLFKPLTSLFNK